MIGEWKGTGEIRQVPSNYDRLPAFDSKTAAHLWVIMTTYLWGGPDVESPRLDTENLLGVIGPGCYFCGEPWSWGNTRTRCKGEVD